MWTPLRTSALLLLAGLSTLAACAGNGDFAVPTDVPLAAVSRIEAFPRTQIPFPPGDWQQLARSDYGLFRQELRGGPFNRGSELLIVTADATERAYADIRNGRIAALYEVKTNTTIANRRGFEAPFACLPGAITTAPLYLRALRGGVPNSYDCITVGPETWQPPGPDASRFDRDVAAAVAARGGVPAQAIAINISAGYAFNRTDVRLLRFPAHDGIPDGNWQPGAEGPRERAYIAELLRYGEGFRRLVARGTWGGLPAGGH